MKKILKIVGSVAFFASLVIFAIIPFAKFLIGSDFMQKYITRCQKGFGSKK
jgi:hypothetical protein